MRKIFANLAMILVIPILYFIFISAFTKEGSSGNESAATNISGTDTTKFINMIMNMDRHFCDSIWVGNDSNLNMYKELGYNSVQVFPVDDSLTYGKFPTPLTGPQIANNQNLIASVKNKALKFFYEHVFLSYLCYAQRLVYEVPTDSGSTTANNGFCYKNVTVAPSSDSSRTVLHSLPGSNHDTTLLCSGIYENLQHSDFFGRQHDDLNWYLKPMVRADLTGIHDSIPIFKIKVINFAGNEDTSIIIKAKNFRNGGAYNNNYTENFYLDIDPINFIISGNKTTGLNKGIDAQGTYLKLCNVDFKIYSYGYVDFYFDKLTVDDEYANKLFDPISANNFDYILQNSLQYIGSDPNLFSYYMDEVTYSQLPCVKYVMDKISAYPADIKFMVSEANWMNANTTRSKNLGHAPMLSLLKPRVLNTFIYEFYNYSYGNVWYPPLLPSDAIGAGNIDPRIIGDWLTNKNSYCMSSKTFGPFMLKLNR